MAESITITTAMAAAQNNSLTQSIRTYSSRLLGFIRKRIGNEEDAEDILQEVLYQFAGNAEPVEQVASWLFKVARNKITDRYRKKTLPLIDDLMVGSTGSDDSFELQELVPSDDDTPETT